MERSMFYETMMRLRRPETQWDTTPIQDPLKMQQEAQGGGTPPSTPPMGLSSTGPSLAALQSAMPKAPPPELDPEATFGVSNPASKPMTDTSKLSEMLGRANKSRANFSGGL